MSHKKMVYLSSAVFSTAAALMLLILIWLVWPYKIMTIHEVQVLNPEVKAGEILQIKIKFEKHMDVHAKVLREIVNAQVIVLSPFESNVPVGPNEWVVPVRIPPSTHPGEGYTVHTTYVYPVNPIRNVRVTWCSPDFTVLPKDERDELDMSKRSRGKPGDILKDPCAGSTERRL